MNRLLRSLCAAAALAAAFAPPAAATPVLDLAARAEAHLAVERVRHAHRIGAPPFDTATARTHARARAETAARLSLALEHIWHTPVTPAMLDAEWARMARGSRDPGRLRELAAALGDDPFLVREVLARPALVERLARRFLQADPGAEWDSWWRTEGAAFDPAALRVARDERPLAAIDAAEPCAGADDAWRNASLDDIPDARQFARAVWTGSELLLWGGYTGSVVLASGGAYDPATDTFRPLSNVGAPPGRYRFTAVWSGSEMIVWGGYTHAGGGTTAGGGRYDPAADTWSPVGESNAPAARVDHAAVWTGTRMIVWGGRINENSGGVYDPATDSWTPTSLLNAPLGRHGHTAIWTGTRMVVWGGQDNTLNGNFLNDGARYDPATDSWSPTSGLLAPSARETHTAVWTGTRMIVWGGLNENGPLRTGGVYDPAANTWVGLPLTNAPEARDLHTAVWSGDAMIVWGGRGTGGELQSGGRFTPATGQWRAIALTGAPAARYFHVAAWTGDRMVVWGGVGLRTYATGGRYDPASDSWTPTATGSAPPARDGHTMVWTGSEAIVWGGCSFGCHADGARYEPATDAWTALPSAGAPEARAGHGAVWSGAAMIVWGGGTAGLDTGALYDPLADAWAAMSAAGAPAARTRHAAAWTGSAMIVHGGARYDAAGGNWIYLADGASYEPSSDSWTPLSAAGAPSPRERHTATWTGSALVVWGGSGGPAGPRGDGAVYHPAAGAWSPMSGAGAPEPRAEHVAAWSGSRVIVWGGSGAVGPLATGAAYDPELDAWSGVSTVNAPEPRRFATAVWGAGRMIVWGGWVPADATGPDRMLDSGGRYDPATDTWHPTATALAATPRQYHASVWAGDAMLVWGGSAGSGVQLSSGGLYCACASQAFFRDADGDGYGDAEDRVESCAAPVGYAALSGDCDDGDAANWLAPGPAGGLRFSGKDDLAWEPPAQPGATEVAYDLLRSPLPADFEDAAVCAASASILPQASDAARPDAGAAFFYLVRARNACGAGSAGADSAGRARGARECP